VCMGSLGGVLDGLGCGLFLEGMFWWLGGVCVFWVVSERFCVVFLLFLFIVSQVFLTGFPALLIL